MLTNMQRDIIRTGYHAVEKGGDPAALQQRVQQLAKDFHVSEDEIRKIGKGSPSDVQTSFPPIAAAREMAAHRSRYREWTAEETKQLKELRSEGKGPAEISRILKCDVNRVKAKIYNLRKTETQAQPAAEASTAERAGAAPAPEPPKEPPTLGVSAPPEKAEAGIPAVKSEPAPGSRDLLDEALRSDSPDDDPEYLNAMAKLTPPPDISPAKEILDLMDHFELAYSAKAGRLQANLSAGWAACTFMAGGYRYTVSLRRKKAKS